MTIGHPCCSYGVCTTPLASNCDKFCIGHTSDADYCSIAGCTWKVQDKSHLCDVPSHQEAQRIHVEWSQAHFQLKKYLEQAKVAHPCSSDPVEAMAEVESIDDIVKEVSSTDGPQRAPAKSVKLKAHFGCQSTHNEQIFLLPCGLIVGWESFYCAEAVLSVVVCCLSLSLSSSTYIWPFYRRH